MKKLLLLFAAILTAGTGLWAETQNVSYRYPVYNTDGVPSSGIKEWKTASVDAAVVSNADAPVTWGAAGTATWYVVTGTDVTLLKGAVCTGNVNLILADGAKLTATGWWDEDAEGWLTYAGIHVSGNGNSLTIYGQTAQTGQLEAYGDIGAAGIGGGESSDGSNITINGGIITAYSSDAAGIGGGYEGDGFNITINRGIVTATSEKSGAGIGGGYGGNGSNITINGGMVTATCELGDGIGGGYKGSGSNIRVATRCMVKAGKSKEGTDEIATDRSDETDIASNLAGMRYVAIETNPVSVTYIDENGESQNVDALEVWSSFDPVTWGAANTTTWYIVNDMNVLLEGAVCQGDVRLILADGAELTATGMNDPDFTPGIQVSGNGNSLTIYGQTDQSGQLEANGGKYAAGIGGGNSAAGSNITINGGTVKATGGLYGAGIGGGQKADGDNITINGGMITANGGNEASGIGGGFFGSGNSISVATTLLVKAEGNNPPTGEIEHDGGGDIAGKLAGKRYAAITSILPFKDAAIAAIDAALMGNTNENIMYFATPAKTNIEAATTTEGINSIKEKALADLQNAFAIYEVGKTEALGPLGEKQTGPAIEVIDQDGKVIRLYNPKKVSFIKVETEE